MTARDTISKYIRIGTYFLPISLPASLIISANIRGAWFGLPVAVLFLVVPALDFLFEPDTFTAGPNDYSKIQIYIMRSAPYLFILAYALALLLCLRFADQLTPFEYALALVSMGATGSINITAAHELIHKHSSISKWFARFGLSLVGYLHFEYSHLFGHHRDAATPADNHTAWAGEPFYSYLIRSEMGAASFCWKFEKKRLERTGRSQVIMSNRMYAFILIPIFYMAGIALYFGASACLLWVIQSVIAIYSLDAVAYIEHYGLMRRCNGERREAMKNYHSWDSYHRFSNRMTFMLQRHGDHHINPSKDYFLLRANNESPQLPVGYPLLILLLGVPGLWDRVICSKENSRINSPSSRKLSYR